MSNTPHLITIGSQTKTLTEWVDEYSWIGVTRSLVLGRIKAGWKEADAIVTAPRKYRTKNREAALIDTD